MSQDFTDESTKKVVETDSNISEHFTKAEMTTTDTGLDNQPNDPIIWERLAKTCAVLERIRTKFGAPIHVNSGYRSDAVNGAVGGSKTSAHHLGFAADFYVVGMDLLETYKAIAADDALMKDADQLIWEQKAKRGGVVRWIHVGVGHGPNGDLPLRHQRLAYTTKTGGKYLPFSEDLVEP